MNKKKQQLIQNALLLNEQSGIIEEYNKKKGDNPLKARILKVIFLINLLKDLPQLSLKSDKKTIADLLIDNLNRPTDDFRNKIGSLIDELVNVDKHLIPIGDEFKLQTRIGAEWEQEFATQANKIRNDDEKLYSFRKEKILTSLT